MRKNEEGKLVDENGLTEEEFLSQYQPRDYERPSVTVDMLIFAVDKSGENKRLLLIKRKNHPYLGCWALPGGFVEMKESLREAAARELEEETGVKGMRLEQLYTFGEVERDPRTRIISVALWLLWMMKSFQSGPGTMQRKLSGSGFGRRKGKTGNVFSWNQQKREFVLPMRWKRKRRVKANGGAGRYLMRKRNGDWPSII